MFRFKQFNIDDTNTAMKIGTDGVLLGAWAFSDIRPSRILDIGTGSGLIALMMAQRFPQAAITAIEIDTDAARQARENISASPWHDNIDIINLDFITYSPHAKFDAIVSNPPFFNEPILSPSSIRNTARHETSLPLPLLLRHAADLLDDNGSLALIIPVERVDQAIYQAALKHLDCTHLTHVYSSDTQTAPIRAMLQLKRGLADTFIRDRITLRHAHNNRPTQQYRQLTYDFYIKL